MRKFVCLFAGLCAGIFTSTAHAAVIWSVDGMGLMRFDSASPLNITRFGAAGVGLMQGLDFAPNGVLYGIGTGGLFSFNTTTGDATPIGIPGLQGEQVLDMSWNPGVNRMEIITAQTSDDAPKLRWLNLANGSATTVGTLGITTPAATYGYAVSANGTRYLHDAENLTMVRLNAGLVGTNMNFVGNGLTLFEGMTIDWSGNGTWYHAGFSGDSGRQELWTIDQTTGVGTFAGVIGGPSYEFNFGDIAINPVPEPTTLALLGLGAVALLRRKGR